MVEAWVNDKNEIHINIGTIAIASIKGCIEMVDAR